MNKGDPVIEKEKISTNQLLILVILFTIGSSILLSPSGFASEAKQDAWLGAIFVTMITPIFLIPFIKLWRQFPDQTLIQINERILGKSIGKTVSLLYLFFFFTICSLLLREIGDFMTISFMPETPIQAIHIIFISVVIMGIRNQLICCQYLSLKFLKTDVILKICIPNNLPTYDWKVLCLLI